MGGPDASNTGPGRAVPAAVVAVSLAVNAAVVLWYGVMDGGDTARYTAGAANLIGGRPFQEKQASYSGYVAVVAACRLAGAGLPGVIAVQVAAAALAALAQYDLGRDLGGRRAGAVAVGFLVLNPDLARWHAFLLTDSLYTSLVVLSTWAFYRAAAGGRPRHYAGAAALVLAAAMVRPNGWALVPVAGAYWAARSPTRPRTRRLGLAAMIAAFALAAWAIPAFRDGIQAERPDAMLYRGQVVWGYDASRLAMPDPPPAPARGWPSALGYAARHPLACLNLAALRVFTELAHVRPFYSRPHNAAVAVSLPLLYALAATGLVRARREPLARLLAAVVAVHLLTVALTFADWDGRFLLYALPALCVLAARATARRDYLVGAEHERMRVT